MKPSTMTSANERLSQIGRQMSAATSVNQSVSDQLLKNEISVASFPRSSKLNGMVAIITGCDSPIGIGKATAFQFAENGCKALYICDVSSKFLNQHAKEIRDSYPDVYVEAQQLDCADEKAVEGLVDHVVSKQGRLDVYFANAGISGGSKIVIEFDSKEFMEIIRINTLSAFLAVKFAAPAMQLTGNGGKTSSQGSIICTASVAGIRSGAGSTPYSCSKAAVISIMQTSAWQLGGLNIRCNAICPGLIETGMTAPTYEAARKRGTVSKIGQLNPTKRGGQPDEIARVAVFLASNEASYVNAQAIAVDGGLSGSHPVVPGKLS